MAVVKVFKEKDSTKYKHTFKTEMKHLEYLLTEYVNREEKCLTKCFTGINCDDDPESAYQDFIATKMEWNKYDPNDQKSREFKHYTISFHPDESKKLGAENINNMCKEICESIPEFKNFQISIATHEDREHIHSHIIVNSVNMVDGHKIQLPKEFLTRFQFLCNQYTASHGLSIHTLPNELNKDDKNVSFNYVDYKLHQNGKLSKTEQFARRLENIIKNTKNRNDLFKAMKDNKLYMKWSDDKKYEDKLYLGKITIEDTTTGEKHRLEKLLRTYNVNISNNVDLLNHFKELTKINKIKNEKIIKDLRLDKLDILKCNNSNELKNEYMIIKKIIKEMTIKQYWDLPYKTDLKQHLKEYTSNIIKNSLEIENIKKEKINELIIKAKEINKNLNYIEAEKEIDRKLNIIIENKIFNIIKYDKTDEITLANVSYMLRSIARCISEQNSDTLSKADELSRKNKLQAEREMYKDIEKALQY